MAAFGDGRARKGGWTVVWGIAALSLLLLAGRGPEAEAKPQRLGAALQKGLTMSGATRHRIVHFTFDDGPDPRTTPRLLDVLDRAGVKATFFFSASRFESRHPRNRGVAELAREVLRRGHTVGSHSVTHQRMAKLGPAALRAELDRARRLFQRVFGSRTWLFRPPFGSRNAALRRMLARRGYTTVMWNIGLADWVKRPAERLLLTWHKKLRRLEQEEQQRGGIVLLHDTHSWSVDAFELIHRDILRRNCELLAQGEELYDIVDDLRPFFTPRRDPSDVGEAAPLRLSEAELERRQARLRRDTRRRCGAGP